MIKLLERLILLICLIKSEVLARYSPEDFADTERIRQTYDNSGYAKVMDFLRSLNNFVNDSKNDEMTKKAACRASRRILMGEVFPINENLVATSSEINIYNELIAKDSIYNSPTIGTLVQEFQQQYKGCRSSAQKNHLENIFQRQFMAVKALSEPLTIQTYSANMPLFSLGQWSDDYQRLCVQSLPELQGTDFVEEGIVSFCKKLKQPFRDFLMSLKKEYEAKPFTYNFGNSFSNPFGCYTGGAFSAAPSSKSSIKYGKPLPPKEQMTREQKIKFLPLGKVNIKNSSSFQSHYATHNGQVTANNNQQSFTFSGSIEIGGEEYSVEEVLDALRIPRDTPLMQISNAITLKKFQPYMYNEKTGVRTPIFFT